MLIDRWARFVNKYDFPVHLVVVLRRIERIVNGKLSTWHLKVRMKFYGIKYGRDIRADGRVIIHVTRRGRISFWDNVIVNSCNHSNLVGRTNPAIFQCFDDGSISVGANSGLSFPVISSKVGVYIGEYVKMGGNVRVFDHDYHALNYAERRDPLADRPNCKSAPVRIGDDVFIGANSIILKGVEIGDRSIIGAGSVVSRSVPADEIWAGNPARKIRSIR